MELYNIISKLNKARRALDSLNQVEILDEWKYDESLRKWYLHINILNEFETDFFPKNSQWYIVVESQYPFGVIKIYPDVENSINVTLYHQSNNSKIETNGLWRKGSLCLDVNTLSNYQPEPYNVDERLLYHVKRTIIWLELASKGELVKKDELFELPEFDLHKVLDIKFVYSEDKVTYLQWESIGCRYGISDLGIYENKPFILYAKTYKPLHDNSTHYVDWGNYLSELMTTSNIKAPWILLNEIPVVNEWQAPLTFGELVIACKKQKIDIMTILPKLISKIRDGKRHFLLIGFPIPGTFGGKMESICWRAIYLPQVSYQGKTAKGFRNNEKGWWMRDKLEIFKSDMKLEWITSENWNQQEISQRGKINELITRKKTLIIGSGCMGATVAELLVRGGTYNITIIDCDLFEIGNLTRHTLSLKSIGKCKETELRNHLNSINPHARVGVINDILSFDEEQSKISLELEKYDVIIDCTGENSVLNILQNIEFKRPHTIISISVGLGAKRLYMSLMNGTSYDFHPFFEIIRPYLEKERAMHDDMTLPRDGIGCWHPTFPGRSDDIWIAAATSVKVIENYCISQSQNTISLVYEQNESQGIFEGFKIVEKKEY